MLGFFMFVGIFGIVIVVFIIDKVGWCWILYWGVIVFSIVFFIIGGLFCGVIDNFDKVE